MEQLTNDLISKLQVVQAKLASGEPLDAEDSKALLIHLLAQEEK